VPAPASPDNLPVTSSASDPVAERLSRIHPDADVQAALAAEGFHSAVGISQHSRGEFLRRTLPRLHGGEARLRQAYAQATRIASTVMHAWATVHTAVRDPHFAGLKVANLGAEAMVAFDELPSYQALFGSLDYCSCDECQSVLGAAAYLVDLLRIIDAYVIQPNSATLPAGFAFADRRPDIGGIPLTCAATNDTFPVLQVVIERLTAQAGQFLGAPADPVEALASASYPFGLPFHALWEQVLGCLGQAGVQLADLYAAFRTGSRVGEPDLARARFGLSYPMFDFACTPLAGDQGKLAASYGISATGLASLAEVPTFLTATGLELAGLMNLLEQDLAASELSAGVAAGFFINRGLGGKWLSYQAGRQDRPASIAGLAAAPADPLDRISRFFRLAAGLGWDYPTLDWALRTVGGGTGGITPEAIGQLGELARLSQQLKVDVPTVCAIVGTLRPYGSADGPSPFDRAFNDRRLAGTDAYHPPTPLNPAYWSAPRSWVVGSADPAQQRTAAWLAAATALPLRDLRTLAAALWGASATVSLSFDNLAALYRHATLQRTLPVTVAGYCQLLALLGHQRQQLIIPTLRLADVAAISDRAAWLVRSGLSLDQIGYFLGRPVPATVDPLFRATAVPDWLSGLRATAGIAAGADLETAVTGQLALLFGISSRLATALAGQAEAATAAPLAGLSWPRAFAAAPTADGKPPYLDFVLEFLSWMSRWLVLSAALPLGEPLLLSVLARPQAYGAALPADFDSVYWLATFAQLSADFGDRAGRLAGFVVPSGQPGADPAAELAAAAGWPPDVLAVLLEPFRDIANRVSVIQSLVAQFRALTALGADPALIARLISLTRDPDTSWADYTELADQLLTTVQARLGSAAQWPAIADQLEGAKQSRLRDALAPLVLAGVRARHPEVDSLDKLSDYLLIDVETSGVPQISRVREALNAAQEYLQRCRLGLEPVQVFEIPEAWWQWLTSFTVWQANREVFLYPENYLDPALRKDATKLFGDLGTALQQGQVTEAAVDTAYRGYLDGLMALSDLEIVDAYQCTVNDAERGPVDSIVLFGRTATDPYRYYTISCANGVWGSWQPIGITIPVPMITPVYAFSRLFVFWVELKVVKDTQLSTGPGAGSSQGVAYQATIRYSFADFNGDWIQPQVLTQDQVVYYMPTDKDETGALGPLKDRLDLFGMADLSWNKVSAVVVNPPAGDGGSPDPARQKLVIGYGSLLSKDAHSVKFAGPSQPPPPLVNPGSNAQMFAQRVYEITTNYNQLVGAGLYGYLPLMDPIVLDHQLNPSYIQQPNELIVLETDLRENAPPLVKPEIERILGTLVLATADCGYVADALADWAPAVATARPPVLVTGQTFYGGVITAVQSQAVYQALVTAGIVADGAVSSSFTGNQDLSRLVPMVGALGVDQVRTALLAALGDPTLFGAVPVKTARVISVKNQPGCFVLSVGDEAFLLTPGDARYASLTGGTTSSQVNSAPMVFDTYFKPVSPDYAAIFQALVDKQVITASPVSKASGTLTGFDDRTDLSFLFRDQASPARKAALTEQVRRILLALPSITMLSYNDSGIPRFVTPTSFVCVTKDFEVNAATSQLAYNALATAHIIDQATGRLLIKVSATTDIESVIGTVVSVGQTAAVVHAVLMQTPKLVQPGSFAAPDISDTASRQAFSALVQAKVLDASGTVSTAFTAATDLSFLFPDQPSPARRAALIGEVRTVLVDFFDSTYRIDSNTIRFGARRISARTSSRELSYALFAGGVRQALSLDSQNAPVSARLPFGRLSPSTRQIAPPPLADGAQVDFDGPYGLYYWELFYHAPLMVASMLAANQQFEQAKRWLEFVLDPTAGEQLVTAGTFVAAAVSPADAKAGYDALVNAGVLVQVPGGSRVDFGYSPATPLGAYFDRLAPAIVARYRAILANYHLATPASHYWQFRPFRGHTLASLLKTLTDQAQIEVYENDPFDPDAVARLRVGAYEKATVMAFLDVLLSWGDWLFAQYTWESVTSATLIYEFAESLLGPRPAGRGPCPAMANPLTFDKIKTMYPAGQVPQFLIDLEDLLPSISGLAPRTPPSAPFNALDAYFGVPANKHLAGYWDRVGDRLRKIRDGENIDGVPAALALWDPPLDPAALVRASASGAGVLPAAANPAATPTSAYRFRTLFDNALQLAAGVSELGATLLAALQNQDAAALELLRATQETAILNLATTIKQQKIDELNATIDGLTSSEARARFQADYYNGLSAAGLSALEQTTAALNAAAIGFQAASVPIHGIAIAGFLAPSIFGVDFGGMHYGDAVNMGASIVAGTSQTMSLTAQLTGLTGEFERRGEEWAFQAALAARDAAVMGSQLEAIQAQLAAAEQDLRVHQVSIGQSSAVSAFLASRFTSGELYSWLAGRLAAVYFQSYTAALAAARAAELAYQYEQNRTDSYIVYGYWDSLHRGLSAGQTLAYSLNQLKAAYQAADRRKLEIEKTISLAQLDPAQVLLLRAGQPASFAITESMLDLDFPGHYARQISSVSVSIPAVVGPYQNINATLTQTSSSVVLAPVSSVVSYLVAREPAGLTAGDPPTGLRQNWLAEQSIAISRGREDNGMFNLDFAGDRYLPFEGTGAVSSWQLEIPPEHNRIDLSQLTDVVITLRYTALDGKREFRDETVQVLKKNKVHYRGKLYLDTAQSFPGAWYAFRNPPPAPATQALTFDVQPGMLPYLAKPVLTGVWLRLDVSPALAPVSSADFVTLTIGGHDHPITLTSGVATLTGLDLAAADFLQPWSVRFTLANAPDPRLVRDGTLDPAALLNVELILSYRADVLGA
jgi:hypothetical protein